MADLLHLTFRAERVWDAEAPVIGDLSDHFKDTLGMLEQHILYESGSGELMADLILEHHPK